MACIFMEGFDHYAWADIAQKPGWITTGGGDGTHQTGRLAGSCRRPSRNTTEDKYVLPSTYATVIFGFGFRPGGTAWPATARTIFNCYQVNATTGVFSIRTDATGHLNIGNAAGTIVQTTAGTLSSGVWVYIEVKVFVNGASGTYEVRLDGSPTPVLSGTANFGSTNIGAFGIGNGATNMNLDYDDMYACDTTGGDNNDFLGDSRVDPLYPVGAGNSTQFTPSAGSNFQNVDETAPNSDTDYNSSSTAGHIDSFDMTTAVGTTAYAVQVSRWLRKTDAGLREEAEVIRQGGTNYLGTTHPASVTYRYQTVLYDKDPLGSSWTVGNINSDEFGYKLVT